VTQNGQLPKLEYAFISYMMMRRSEVHKYKKYHKQKYGNKKLKFKIRR